MKRLLALLAVVALVLAGCAGDEEQSEGGGAGAGDSGPPVSLSGPTNNHGIKAASGSMEVELDDFYFGPTFITARPGQEITLQLKNEGKVPHTFTSSALGSIDEELDAGATRTVKITVPQSGTALFICRFHQAQGMQGAIVVQ